MLRAKNTNILPVLVSSLLRSELLGHEEALVRHFPWSLGESGMNETERYFHFYKLNLVHVEFM